MKKSEYEKLIRDLDGVISEIRSFWLPATETEKPKWMKRINELLDRRIGLMNARDMEE